MAEGKESRGCAERREERAVAPSSGRLSAESRQPQGQGGRPQVERAQQGQTSIEKGAFPGWVQREVAERDGGEHLCEGTQRMERPDVAPKGRPGVPAQAAVGGLQRGEDLGGGETKREQHRQDGGGQA